MISLIVAYNEDNVIGVDNKLPWHLPEDMKWFKAVTQGAVVVMGKNTWDTIKKPLPNRDNVVISRTMLPTTNVTIFDNLLKSVEYAKSKNKDLFFIGGQKIYEEAIPLVDRMYITHVNNREWDGSYDDNDRLRKTCVFFPHVNMDEWEAISCETYSTHKSIIYSRII